MRFVAQTVLFTAAIATLFTAAIATLSATEAFAGASCGSSGSSSGGGSSSSSSGGGSSSDGDSSSSSSTPVCEQTTTTVGRAECRNFGDGWDRSRVPRIRLSMGLVHQSLSLANLNLEGKSTHDGKDHNYHYDPRAVGGDGPQAELFGGTFGMDFLIRNAHIGVEAGVVGGSSDGAEQVSPQGLRMRSTHAMQVQGKLVAGYSARMGRWGVIGELQTGTRVTMVEVETRLEDCISTDMTTKLSAVLEPRVGLQRWLSPWLTTDLSVGSDLMQKRDLSVTLSLTAHSRSYDGQY